MLKNETDVLVIAHNICVAFDDIDSKRQDIFVRRLREIERDACTESSGQRESGCRCNQESVYDIIENLDNDNIGIEHTYVEGFVVTP